MKARKRKARTTKAVTGKKAAIKKKAKFVHRTKGGRQMSLAGSYRDGPCPSGHGVCRCYYNPSTGNYDANCRQIG